MTLSASGIRPSDVVENWEKFGETVFDFSFPEFANDSSLKDLIANAVDLGKQMDENETALAAMELRHAALFLAIEKHMNGEQLK